MAVIGFDVTKQQKQILKDIVREMCLTQFAHPQDTAQFVTFLPPGAGLGTLVKVAVEQYVEYFKKVKAESLARAQQKYDNPVPKMPLNAEELAQAAVTRSETIRHAQEIANTVTQQGAN
jgi:hypothetical protein